MAAQRRVEVRRGDLQREFRSDYPTVDHCVIDMIVDKVLTGTTAERAREVLQQQAVERALVEYDKQGDASDTERQLHVYVTSQTGDRSVRDRCRGIKLCFDCLKIPYVEVDVTENKWLRKHLASAAKEDTLPLCFMGSGPDADFLGTWPHISNIVDEGELFDYLERHGYRHEGCRPKQIVFQGEVH
eukprot:TRINITY_DN1978_c0_g1_i1.p1 TRINITY_DN1978_c0_g1~~TRINITY_DN1978_c0_g1_i1.p1  ORF type:complete len:186 (+),score=73.07 TRINITY_DN1978_c0_g1_i1:87-644(+)